MINKIWLYIKVYRIMHDVIEPSVKLTNAAVNKIKYFIRTNKIQHQRAVDIKLRVYIIGGGCGGFQYGFILDDQVSNDDCIIENSGASVVIDPMSLQYLFGGIIDYHEGLEGSKFIVINPNAKMTCSCGSSFSV